MNPLSPSFPMENKKQDEALRKQVERITTPIFNKVLQETKSKSMTAINNFKFLWRPHNYRLKIPIHYKKIDTSKVLFCRKKYTKSNNKHTIKDFKGITVEINKTCIVIIYSSKKWYYLKGSMPELNNKLNCVINKIKNKCIKKAQELSKLCNFRAYIEDNKWIRHEDHIKGEDFLPKIDPKLIMHDTVFKKVYPEGIEFKSPFHLKSFINNRAIDMVAPQIVDAINNNTQQLQQWTKAVRLQNKATNLEIKNKQLHMKVLNDMSATLKHLNSNILRVKYSGRRLSGLEKKLIH